MVVYCVNDFLFVCAEYSAIRRFPVDTRCAGAGGIVIARSIATDKFSGKDLAKMLAIIGAINGIAPVVAPIIGGVFTEAIGWQGIFIILLVLGVLLLIGCMRFRESLPAENRLATKWADTFNSFKVVLRNKQ